jgi:hypothetical protein
LVNGSHDHGGLIRPGQPAALPGGPTAHPNDLERLLLATVERTQGPCDVSDDARAVGRFRQDIRKCHCVVVRGVHDQPTIDHERQSQRNTAWVAEGVYAKGVCPAVDHRRLA